MYFIGNTSKLAAAIVFFLFMCILAIFLNFNFNKNPNPINGIVIQTSQGVLDNNGFEEKRIYIHDEDDQDWKIVYIFRFKFEESPEVMLGQPVQFSIVKSKEYLRFNDKTFVPYLVEKQHN